MIKQTQKTSLSLLCARKSLSGLRLVFLLVALTGVFLYTRMGAPARVEAATSSNLNFQARLLNASGGLVPDGTYNIEFKLYDTLAAGSSAQGVCVGGATDDCLWVETRTGANKVTIKNGYFSVNLASVTAFPALNWDQDMWLTMNIGGTGAPAYDGEMSPRIKLTAVPYAFQAGAARTLVQNQGTYTGTVDFNTLTADRKYVFPDTSLATTASPGTICVYNGAASNCPASSGSAYYIQNDTVTQTANFNVQSAAAGNIGAVIQGHASQTADILQVKVGGGAVALKVASNGDSDFDSNTLFVDAANNRVGVGLNNPSAALHVSSAAAAPLFRVTDATATAIDVLNIADGGAATFRNQTDSTAALQVQSAASGTPVLTVDTTNSQTIFRGINSDAVVSGTELVQSQDFTNATYWDNSTGWTETTTTATHTTGNTTVLTATAANVSVTAGTTYQVQFQVSGNTTATNTVTPSIGGVSGPALGANTTHTVVITASTTGVLTFTPTTSFNGTISAVSVKAITTTKAVLQVKNASDVVTLEVRASGSTTNSFIGLNAGLSNTTGIGITAVGSGALQANTTGSQNTAIGQNALLSNTTGSRNTAIGQNALQNNTSGADNTALGRNALQLNTTGNFNVALGVASLSNNLTGSSNVAVGYQTLQGNTTGDDNIALGHLALFANTTGTDNIAIGTAALDSNTTGIRNVAIGVNALTNNNTGTQNTAIGYQAMLSNTTGTFNAALGWGALLGNTTGSQNVGIGRDSGRAFGTGSNNTALGHLAGYTDGTFATLSNISTSTALGYNAQVQASNSVVLGAQGANVGIGTTIPTNTFSVSPMQYNTGTASQSTTTVTGTGTTFTSAMVGSEIIFANGAKATITGFTDATTLTVTPSQTVSVQAYRIHYPGLQVTNAGNVGVGVTTTAAKLEVAATPAGSQKTLVVNNSTSTGNILEVQDNGSAVFTVADGGNITATGTYNTNTFNSNTLTFGGASATTISSATGQSLTVDSGTTGAINIGTGAFAKTLTIGSTDTTSATTIQAGSGNINLNASIAQFSEITGTRTLTVQTRTTNDAGTALTIAGGTAGSGASAFSGGLLTLQGGAAGGTGNANGANVVIQGGAGVGTGVQGLVSLSASSFAAASTQSFGVNGSIAQSVIDSNSAVPVNATAVGLTITLPTPTQNVVGRILYITVVNGSNSFTIAPSGGTSFTLNQNVTATFLWNGSAWTNAGVDGGSAAYIQNQSSQDQSANFRISGSGRANTSFISPLFTTLDSQGSGNSPDVIFKTGNASTGNNNFSGSVTIKSGDATNGSNGSSGNVSIDSGSKIGTGTAGSITLGATNASALTLGRAGITTTVNGSLTVATGSTFTNASSTLFTALVITDKPTGGAIGTAAATVDVATTFDVNQTTASQTLTLPNPTVTSAGRIAFVSNVGSTSFTMYGVIISPSTTSIYFWNGTVWTPAGIDGSGANYIQNQSASDQTGNFRISGTGRANTSLQAPLFDTATAVALAIGTTNATAINLNQNTTIAAAKTLTVTSGATSLTGASTGVALTVNNSTSTGNIFVAQDNGTPVFTIADGGIVSLTQLGAADNQSYICRNSSNQLATCNTTGAGAAFTQGGNTFAATAVLGTNDANNLQIHTGSAASATTIRATFDQSNNLYLGNGVTAATPSAFTVQGTGSTTAGTAGGALTVKGGAGTTTTTGSAGGALVLQGGAGGTPATTGNATVGGAVNITGGAASGLGAANALGGAVNIQGGVSFGTTTGSGVNITGGAGIGTNQNGGNVALDGGALTGSGTKGYVVLQGSGGNVGIGDTTPDYKLEIQGSSGSGYFAITNSTDGDILAVDSSGNLSIGGDVTIAAQKTLRLVGGTTAQRPASPAEGMLFFDTDTKQLLVYGGAAWQNMSRSSTKVVAASNSQTPAGADYQVTAAEETAGNADSKIQSAINTLPAGGGTVYLMEGTYTIDTAISIPSNVTLAGSGASTIIKMKADGGLNRSHAAIVNSDTTNGNSRITLRDFKLEGNKGNNLTSTQDGINFTKVGSGTGSSTIAGSLITNLLVENFRDEGISINDSLNNTIHSNTILNNESNGIGMNNINVAGYSTTSAKNVVTGNRLSGNGTGISFASQSGGVISSNTIEGHSSEGILTTDAYQTVINGNNIASNISEGISLEGDKNIVSDNKLYDNGGSSSLSSIKIVIASLNSITGNDITDTAGTGYAIYITDALSVDNYLADNTYSGTGAASIQDLGTGTIYGGQLTGNNDFILQQAAGVGIGTTTPGAKLEIKANAGGSQKTLIVNNSTSTGNILEVQDNGTAVFTIADGGLVSFTQLGAADNSSYICRNSSNQLAACNTTGTGAAFVQGGNTFGVQALLGTNDNNSLAFRTNSGNRLILDTSGNLQFQQASTITTVAGGNLSISTGTTGNLNIDSGTTGAVNIATGANAKVVTIGSTDTTSSVTLQTGSGNLNFNTSQAQFTEVTGTRTLTVQTRTTNLAGTALTISAGTAGTGASAFTGGLLTLQGGNAAGTGNANGGNVLLTGGTGTGTGVRGLVVIDTPTYTTATQQNCIATPCTITQANVDSTGAVIVHANDTGYNVTLPDPTNLTAGRIVYVTAANGSADFTLVVNGGGTGNQIAMRQNTTATMIWNGSDWTAAGASSSTTLQAAYDNTLTAAGGAEIVLNNTASANGLTIRNNSATPIIGGILEAQTSIGSNLFSVNNNAIEYATNGGAETVGSGGASTFPASTWDATTGGTVDRYTTAGDNIATGQAAVRVQATAINHGARNQLSTTLVTNLTYSVSFAVRGSVNFSTLQVLYSPDGTTTGTTTCATAQTVTAGAWTRILCTFVATGSINSSNSILIRQTDGTTRTFYIDNLSVNVNASTTFAADGSVDSALGTNWTTFGAGTTVTRDTTTLYDTSGSVKVDTTNAADRGVTNNLAVTPAVSTQYLVTYYAKLSSGTFTDIRVRYSRDGGTNFVSCVDYNTQTLTTTGFTKITCLFTTDGTIASNPDLIIDQPTAPGGTRTFYVDALSVTLNTNNSNNVQVGGANRGGPTTLFTLDRASSAPIAANNDAYLGSMYYDTTSGRIQCYEADGWGACGSAPDNIVNLNPEFSGAVLNGTGVGTMTADFCGNGGGLTVNISLCSSGQARNFYKWTSPQSTEQTYSIYVTYQLPASFKSFASDETVQLTARTDSTANGSVTYQMYRNESGAITACGTETTVASATANQWDTVGINGNEATSCGFTTSSANAFVIFKINVKAKSNANVYVGTLGFTTTGR